MRPGRDITHHRKVDLESNGPLRACVGASGDQETLKRASTASLVKVVRAPVPVETDVQAPNAMESAARFHAESRARDFEKTLRLTRFRSSVHERVRASVEEIRVAEDLRLRTLNLKLQQLIQSLSPLSSPRARSRTSTRRSPSSTAQATAQPAATRVRDKTRKASSGHNRASTDADASSRATTAPAGPQRLEGRRTRRHPRRVPEPADPSLESAATNDPSSTAGASSSSSSSSISSFPTTQRDEVANLAVRLSSSASAGALARQALVAWTEPTAHEDEELAATSLTATSAASAAASTSLTSLDRRANESKNEEDDQDSEIGDIIAAARTRAAGVTAPLTVGLGAGGAESRERERDEVVVREPETVVEAPNEEAEDEDEVEVGAAAWHGGRGRGAFSAAVLSTAVGLGSEDGSSDGNDVVEAYARPEGVSSELGPSAPGPRFLGAYLPASTPPRPVWSGDVGPWSHPVGGYGSASGVHSLARVDREPASPSATRRSLQVHRSPEVREKVFDQPDMLRTLRATLNTSAPPHAVDVLQISTRTEYGRILQAVYSHVAESERKAARATARLARRSPMRRANSATSSSSSSSSLAVAATQPPTTATAVVHSRA